MRRAKAVLAAAAVSGALALSAGPASARAEPDFRPERFFAGRTHAEGAFVDSAGRPESRFVGDTIGQRRGGATVFDQVIRFDDGTIRRRRWRLVRTGREVAATATDVVGIARGRIDGRTLRLDYVVRTRPGIPLLDVEFEQHLTLEPGGRTVANRSIIRKFGIPLRDVRERFVQVSSRQGRSR